MVYDSYILRWGGYLHVYVWINCETFSDFEKNLKVNASNLLYERYQKVIFCFILQFESGLVSRESVELFVLNMSIMSSVALILCSCCNIGRSLSWCSMAAYKLLLSGKKVVRGAAYAVPSSSCHSRVNGLEALVCQTNDHTIAAPDSIWCAWIDALEYME